MGTSELPESKGHHLLAFLWSLEESLVHSTLFNILNRCLIYLILIYIFNILNRCFLSLVVCVCVRVHVYTQRCVGLP